MTALATQAAEFAKMFEPEPLAPELEQAKERRGRWLGIYHPLVVQPIYQEAMNRMMNLQLAQKKEKIAEAKAKPDWERYVFLHERPFRFQAFIEHMHKMSNRTYWRLLADVWTDAEGCGVNFRWWRTCFNSSRPNRERLMLAKERAKLAALPDTFTIYRGAEPRHRKGLSWTIDREKAEWFARRFQRGGKVYSATARKVDVIAYFDCRGESEIVIDPEELKIDKP